MTSRPSRRGVAGVERDAALPAGGRGPDDSGDAGTRSAGSFTSPHAPDASLVSDTCADCHRTHVAQGPNLLAEPAPAGDAVLHLPRRRSGSDLDTQAQYADPAVPANDRRRPAASYYRHDAATARRRRTPTRWRQDDEFGGVSNRHSECADCHNSHNATATASTQIERRLVGVRAGRPRSPASRSSTARPARRPTYTFLDGTAGSQPTREYQICLKCHSGFTTLPAQRRPVRRRRRSLDKAVELNPWPNASYHPVEAAGTNDRRRWRAASPARRRTSSGTSRPTARSAASTATATRAKFNATCRPPADRPAGADLAPHTSQFRGLLIQNYRDRVLKGPARGVRRRRLRPLLRVPRGGAVPQQHVRRHRLPATTTCTSPASPSKGTGAAPTSTRRAQGGATRSAPSATSGSTAPRSRVQRRRPANRAARQLRAERHSRTNGGPSRSRPKTRDRRQLHARLPRRGPRRRGLLSRPGPPPARRAARSRPRRHG